MTELRRNRQWPPLIKCLLREVYHGGERVRQLRTTTPHLLGSIHGGIARRQDPLLVGYFEMGFGLGEFARSLARALDAVGQPFGVYPYRAYTRRATPIRSWASHYDVWRAHDINIFCMAGNQVGQARRILGRRRVAGATNILATFWELSAAPATWRPILAGFDEIWAPNAYVANAFRPVFDGPITTIAPCVDVGEAPSADRQRFALDADRFWFLFSFDFDSRAARKNPLGVLEAFADAFPRGDERVGVIIKSNGDRGFYPDAAAALDAAAARDPIRIRLVHAEMERATVLSLMASVDCYVSLHRGEGFGLGMAESMLLGVPVVGTAYSGNVDFLRDETGYPIPYRLVPIPPGAYPHGEGLEWAEPDHAAAVATLRDVVANPEERQRRAARGREEIAVRYSPIAVGRAAAARLDALRAASSAKES